VKRAEDDGCAQRFGEAPERRTQSASGSRA
jgi:hypothetical protein